MHRRAIATAPASIANLGPLFDLAALAVEAFRDRVEVEVVEELGSGIRVEVEAEGAPGGKANTAYAAAYRLLEYLGETLHVRIRVEKRVPPGRGLGSSGATAAATVYALNMLLGEPFTREELIRFAGEAEAVAAGAPHFDNVAASLLGGLVVLLDRERPLAAKLELPQDVRLLLFIPEGDVVKVPEGMGKTEAMRSVIPHEVETRACIGWMEKALRLTVGLGVDPYLALQAANYGGPVEAARSRLIPGYNEAKRVALEAGAIAFNISGAGPSLFAIVREDSVEEVRRRVTRVLEKSWGRLSVVETGPDEEGARLE